MDNLRLWRWVIVTATAILFGTAAAIVRAAPSALDCRNIALTAPLPGSTLSGAVEVRGRALILDFQFYKVEYSPLGRDQWVLIGTPKHPS